MMVLKNLLAVMFLTFLICAPNVEAADKPRVMFMDLGTHSFSISQQLASDYLVESLVTGGNFIVTDFETLKETIHAQRRNSEESYLSAARKIAEQFNIDYLIYGNFDRADNDNFMLETKFEKQKFQSIQAVLIVRMMNVKTGEIVAVVKGEGVSKRSELDAEDLKTLDNNKVPMNSVHNAIRKAAFDAVDKLIKNFPES